MEKGDALEAKINECMAVKAETKGDATNSAAKDNGEQSVSIFKFFAGWNYWE